MTKTVNKSRRGNLKSLTSFERTQKATRQERTEKKTERKGKKKIIFLGALLVNGENWKLKINSGGGNNNVFSLTHRSLPHSSHSLCRDHWRFATEHLLFSFFLFVSLGVFLVRFNWIYKTLLCSVRCKATEVHQTMRRTTPSTRVVVIE